MLPAQHAATHARLVHEGSSSPIRGLLRAHALQRHSRLAGSGQRHDHLLPRRATGLHEAVSHARRFLLVLHGHRHGESRQVSRFDLFPRRQDALCESVHSLDRAMERAGGGADAVDNFPGVTDDPACAETQAPHRLRAEAASPRLEPDRNGARQRQRGLSVGRSFQLHRARTNLAER